MDGEKQRIVDAAVVAAVAGYADVLNLAMPLPTALVLLIYWDGDAVYQLAPPPFALPADKPQWCEAHERHAEVWEALDPPERKGVELEMPELDEDPAMQALLETLREVPDGDLIEQYLEALAARLTQELGVPVLVQGMDVQYGRPLEDQLKDRLSPDAHADLARRDLLPRDRSAETVLREWDVVLHAPLPAGGIAGVHRTDRGLLLGGRLSVWQGSYGEGIELDGPLLDVGGDPQVVGGLLPAGATRVEVTDLFDVVHYAQVSAGAWLCVLPHSARGGEPPVRFLDATGACVLSLPQPATPSPVDELEAWVSFGVASSSDRDADLAECEAQRRVEARAVLRAVTFEVAWPEALGGTPELTSWSDPEDGPVTSLSLGTDEAEVELGVTEYRDELEPARSALDAYDRALSAEHSQRERARLVATSREMHVPGRWERRELQFTARVGAGRWSAVAVAQHRRYVVITGFGTPPERLDLVPFQI